ncbi:RICIN domain-containing protein [Streptomyces sp. NPDC037389]|uniref:RICIN domain-containing protein n=1 Tax=Streptomyces sp. NPDC037389 TaxID=3155369 RepID=UPI0033DF3E64
MKRFVVLITCCAAALAALPPVGASATSRHGAQAHSEGSEISFAEFVARFGPKDPMAQARILAGGFTIRNRYSKKCLDADPGQSWDGGQVYLWDCNGTEWQKWTFTSQDDRNAVHAYDGRVLDAVLNDTNGSAITRYRWRGWSDGGDWNQQWKFYTSGEIKSAWNRRCLDGDPAQKDSKPQRTWLWDCNGEDWQKWDLD